MATNKYLFSFFLLWFGVLACFVQSTPITENTSNIKIETDWPPNLTVKKGFYLSPHKANWYSAHMYCKTNNTRLARVESQREHDELVQIIKDSDKSLEWYWLGGTDMPEEGTWSWMFLGKKIKGFKKWGPGEPNSRGGPEDCLNFGRKDDEYLWNDESCLEEFYFVCEYYALSTVPECVSHDQCPVDRACQASRCVDPCEDRCGSNTVCRVQNHIPTCACKAGFTGNPLDACNEYAVPECVSHDQCPVDKACQASRCVDPCEDRCGSNTVCRVQHHIPTCACKAGFTGNPLDACNEYEIKMEWPPKYPGKKKKFYLETFKKLNWHGAYFQFMRNNSRLASVESSLERDELMAMIDNMGVYGESFWLGGSDLAIEGRWLWSNGQDLRTFTDWGPNGGFTEPNNIGGNESCLELRFKNYYDEKYKWNDFDCSQELYSICEYY